MLKCYLEVVHAESSEYHRVDMLDQVPSYNAFSGETLFGDQYYDVEIIIDVGDVDEVEDLHFFVCEEEISIKKIETKEKKVKYVVDNREVGNKLNLGLYYNLLNFYAEIKTKQRGTIKLYSKKYMCDWTEETDQKNVEVMLLTLLDMDDDMHNMIVKPFDLDKISGSDITAATNNAIGIKRYLKKAEEILKFYKQKLSYFKNYACHKIVAISKKQPYEKARGFSISDFTWLMQNMEQLKEVEFSTSIEVEDKNFLPNFVNSQVFKKDNNTYENTYVLFLLQDVCNILKEVYLKYGKTISEYKEKKNYSTSTPRWYKNNIETLISLFSRRCEKVEKLKKEGELLLHSYKIFFNAANCNDKRLDLPRRTKIFQEIPAYIEVYRLIRVWMSMPKYNPSAIEDELLTIVKLDKVYEYFCLVKIIEMFQSLNDIEIDKNKIRSFHYAERSYDNDTFVFNTYEIENNSYVYTIYYQPVLSTDKLENGISLYKATNNSYYTPDFIIKIKKKANGKAGYIILDAKFSKLKTLKDNKTLINALNKYYFEIADAESTSSTMIAIGLLHGKPGNDKIYLYHNSPLAKKKLHLPLIFVNPLNIESFSLMPMWENFGSLISVYFNE